LSNLVEVERLGGESADGSIFGQGLFEAEGPGRRRWGKPDCLKLRSLRPALAQADDRQNNY
jgi:hypothetical protein